MTIPVVLRCALEHVPELVVDGNALRGSTPFRRPRLLLSAKRWWRRCRSSSRGHGVVATVIEVVVVFLVVAVVVLAVVPIVAAVANVYRGGMGAGVGQGMWECTSVRACGSARGLGVADDGDGIRIESLTTPLLVRWWRAW